MLSFVMDCVGLPDSFDDAEDDNGTDGEDDDSTDGEDEDCTDDEGDGTDAGG